MGIEDDGVLKWGFIDKTGAWVIQPQFDGVGFFSEGLAPVAVPAPGNRDVGWVAEDLYSYIDTTGKVVIALQQGQVPHEFSGGLTKVDAYADVTKGPDSMAYIDTTGKVIWQGE